METPTIKPFTESAQCVKCGAADQILTPMMGMGIGSMFCPGGKQLEEEQEKNPVEAFLSLLPAITNLGGVARKPKINICAGVTEEHLHKTCPRCGYEWLIHTKPA